MDGPGENEKQRLTEKAREMAGSLLIAYAVTRDEAYKTTLENTPSTSRFSEDNRKLSIKRLENLMRQDVREWFLLFDRVVSDALDYGFLFSKGILDYEDRKAKDTLFEKLLEQSPYPNGRWFMIHNEGGQVGITVKEVSRNIPNQDSSARTIDASKQKFFVDVPLLPPTFPGQYMFAIVDKETQQILNTIDLSRS